MLPLSVPVVIVLILVALAVCVGADQLGGLPERYVDPWH